MELIGVFGVTLYKPLGAALHQGLQEHIPLQSAAYLN